ncbi:unnamed protein product [Mytilus edulis]|uniref:Uncharacterized protein n=1 Tax=Mytilus edulis TaxID=6550 RepID=A0A8S3PRQ6_MYTED|nr:unnamed protein product [Mytilus edulis]
MFLTLICKFVNYIIIHNIILPIIIKNVFILSSIIQFLLLVAGIEQNPGPDQSNKKNLKIVHKTVCSLLPKLDLINNELHEYDIICISESHLDKSITDDQIKLNGFHKPIRLDRNRHGGGVTIYVKNSLHFIIQNDISVSNLELLWVEPTRLPVKWLKEGNAVKLDEHYEQSNEGTELNLKIKNVTSDDSGEYCVEVGNFSRKIHLKIEEQFRRCLEQWKKDDQQFVSTEAEKHVMQKVLTQSSVTLVGNSGTGKSFLSKHIALIMKKHGYTVIPCSKPEDIGKWFKNENLVTHLNQLDLSKQQELVCTKDIYSKDIALSGSCYMGTIELVKWLISRNSDINYCREDGWFPLLWASQKGHVDVVKELLQHSADVNKCTNGTSSLQMACTNNKIEVVHVLLQSCNVQIDLCDVNGCSSLYQAKKGLVGICDLQTIQLIPVPSFILNFI